ncbi:hypothetical protein [Massilia consociata]
MSFTDGGASSIFRTSFGGPMWGAATLYLYDFQLALRGKCSPYMIEFYSGIKKDLFSCFTVGLTLALLFFLAPNKYNFSNIDLAFLGMPFLAVSFFDVLTLRHLEIGKTSLLKRPIYGLLALLVTGYVLFFHWAYEIFTNTYSQSQALWMQITIFATGLYAFIASKFLLFALNKERLEIFPSLRKTLCITERGKRIFDSFESAVEQWNTAVEKQKIADINADKEAAKAKDEKKKQKEKKKRKNRRR